MTGWLFRIFQEFLKHLQRNFESSSKWLPLSVRLASVSRIFTCPRRRKCMGTLLSNSSNSRFKDPLKWPRCQQRSVIELHPEEKHICSRVRMSFSDNKKISSCRKWREDAPANPPYILKGPTYYIIPIIPACRIVKNVAGDVMTCIRTFLSPQVTVVVATNSISHIHKLICY